MPSAFYSVVVDSRDPAALARFWGEVLGYVIVHEAPDEVVIVSPSQTGPGLVFGTAPEVKVGKNRLHIDLNPSDQAAEVERIVGLGARRVDIGQGTQPWVVLADPEGNEFCVLTARDFGPTP